MPDLAVVIVSWNVRDLLVACLRTVQTAIAAAGLDGEIWVVDNASYDGSVELLSSRFPRVHAIASPTNLGFGGGNNLALRAIGFQVQAPVGAYRVTYDGTQTPLHDRSPGTLGLPQYVLFLNPDAAVRKDAVGCLVRFMAQNPRVGVCGPRLVYGDGGFQHAAYRFPSLVQLFLDFWPINWRLTDSRINGRYPKRLYAGGEPFEIDHPLGAAMLFRRDAIEQTGGFDLDYRMYVEEIDWCMRIKRAGWRICCVPRAEVVHYEGQSTAQIRPQMAAALWKSRYILFKKHYSARYRWLARRLIRAGMRSKIRQVQARARRGETTEADARAMSDAYRQVVEM